MSTDGLIVVDKPGGMTSHDVVARIRRLARTRRVGHGGTLDPMATGVLVIGVGRATRLLTYVIGSRQELRATIRLGEATVTDDAEGEVVAHESAAGVTERRSRAALRDSSGRSTRCRARSARSRSTGVRAYARVRKGEDVELAGPSRSPSAALEVLSIRARDGDVVDVDVDVTCSSGTYIRAIARDSGLRSGSVAT